MAGDYGKEVTEYVLVLSGNVDREERGEAYARMLDYVTDKKRDISHSLIGNTNGSSEDLILGETVGVSDSDEDTQGFEIYLNLTVAQKAELEAELGGFTKLYQCPSESEISLLSESKIETTLSDKLLEEIEEKNEEFAQLFAYTNGANLDELKGFIQYNDSWTVCDFKKNGIEIGKISQPMLLKLANHPSVSSIMYESEQE